MELGTNLSKSNYNQSFNMEELHLIARISRDEAGWGGDWKNLFSNSISPIIPHQREISITPNVSGVVG